MAGTVDTTYTVYKNNHIEGTRTYQQIVTWTYITCS